jgi:hypothetical protein
MRRGGFSNVWGATVLPYHARDIVDWPFVPMNWRRITQLSRN